MNEAFTFIRENWEAIVNIATSVVAAAAPIAALTPGEADNRIVSTVRKIVDLLALNVGNAKNEKKPR